MKVKENAERGDKRSKWEKQVRKDVTWREKRHERKLSRWCGKTGYMERLG
jgi:hypothetical protein